MDLQNAMKSPGAVFVTPEVLDSSTDLSAEQKRALSGSRMNPSISRLSLAR
jgi:hypothetical protein